MSAYGMDSGAPVFTFIDPFSLCPFSVHLYGMIVATCRRESETLITPL
ncbi:9820_t:CDS:1, partial [Gigaspora rosea]